ncbi:MAG: peptidylprolyl isomerase [Pseudohongiellaceae bacterium]
MKSPSPLSSLAGCARCLMVAASLLLTLPAPALAQSNPVVRISTTYGDFSIELFEEQTPATVENFLGYVGRGDYRRTFLHRLESDFVVQGGGYRFIPGCSAGVRPCGPVEVPQQAPVQNEPGISNTRGTVAMAKLSGDPDSATSQWFVNLDDNSEELDDQNGGFTAFGEVLGDGMDVLDRIAEQATYNLCDTGESCFAGNIPLRNFESSGRLPVDAHFIHINPTRVSRFSTALHVFEPSRGVLVTTVDGGDGVGRYSLRMQVVANSPDIVFEVVPESLIPLGSDPEGKAVWDPETGRLEIPRVEVNTSSGANVVTNVEMSMQSESPMRFVLESWEE